MAIYIRFFLCAPISRPPKGLLRLLRLIVILRSDIKSAGSDRIHAVVRGSADDDNEDEDDDEDGDRATNHGLRVQGFRV
jgi:hypothetical protein